MIEMIQGHEFVENIFNKDDSLVYDLFTKGIKLDYLQII